MALPLAYFLTWTCYGQRLPGDERGWVGREYNIPGTPLGPPSEVRESLARGCMSNPPFQLSVQMIPVADRGLVELCEERGWRLLARAVRPTHTHVVMNCRGAITPERAMSQLKARMTRSLHDAALVEGDRHLWTRHGSTRWINHEAGLVGAVAYVNEWQTGPNREMLEAHRQSVRERIDDLRVWLRAQGLPESGLTVVAGESRIDRAERLNPSSHGRRRPGLDEPRTQ